LDNFSGAAAVVKTAPISQGAGRRGDQMSHEGGSGIIVKARARAKDTSYSPLMVVTLPSRQTRETIAGSQGDHAARSFVRL
jgi:hypothetical protein